jgi:hypothetical protein
MDVPFTDLRMDSIANPHLNDDPGAIITFPGETFGLSGTAVGLRRNDEYMIVPDCRRVVTAGAST